jgi:hypothetical protein
VGHGTKGGPRPGPHHCAACVALSASPRKEAVLCRGRLYSSQTLLWQTLFEADNVKDFAEINRHSDSDSLTGELCGLPSKLIAVRLTLAVRRE